jgi:hypothetical protein
MNFKLTPLWGAALLVCAVVGFARCAEITIEGPIMRSGVAITVSVSTSAWTLSNTATSKLEQRAGYRITNPTSNTAAMYAVCHESTPTEAITVKINEIAKGSNMIMPCGNNMNLYLLSVNTSAENANVWEIGQ